jgi:hypothetical protein
MMEAREAPALPPPPAPPEPPHLSLTKNPEVRRRLLFLGTTALSRM